MALTPDQSGHPAAELPSGRATFAGLRDAAREITGYWWLQLAAGIAWVVLSLVMLQFDSASITTIGVLVGLMFTGSAAQNFALATATGGATRWTSAIFGGLFVAAAVVCFVEPQNTFAAVADSLGF